MVKVRMKKKLIIFNIIIAIFLCGVVFIDGFYDKTMNVSAMNTAEAGVLYSTSSVRSGSEVFISGAEPKKFDYQLGIIDFSDIKYVQNANYFLINPKHKENDSVDNTSGVCATVAMQMLLGYHNYYSDRRIIPTQVTAEDGKIKN